MKKLLLLICCFATVTMYASTVVKGQMISAADKKPLSYATVSVADKSNPQKTVKKFATDEKGNFSTSLEAGDYIFTFYFVGMVDVTKEVNVTNDKAPTDLGKIEMKETSIELDEISVTAQRPLVKVDIDKLVYSAKEDPEAATSNVLDLLRKVPLVTVDGEEKIQLKGSSSFKIYLNGKPSNMISNNPTEVLKSMPANSIKDIEVITDPGAKYDAEGVTGIINIITDKRVDDGYSGSVGANGNINGGYGGHAYLATKYGKIGFTGNAYYYNYKNPESNTSYERKDFAPNNNLLTQEGTANNGGNGASLYGTLSYEPDTLNLFNISVSNYSGKHHSDGSSKAISTGIQNYSFDMFTNSVGKYGGTTLTTDYQRTFNKKGELLTLSYRFENDPGKNENETRYDNVTGVFYYPSGRIMKSINDQDGIEHTGQIDYVNPINKMHSIETGLKYIFRDNSGKGTHTFYDAVNAQWHNDPTRKNDLDHTQKIASGYLGYGFKKDKFGIKAGLRGEQTNQEVHYMNKKDTVIHSKFFDLVPSATLSYQLSMTKTLRAGYNMRISRPGIWYLNPYINEENPINIYYGNPELVAEQTHNFNINYGSFSQKLNLNVSLNYSYTENAITSYSFVKDGVTHNTYDNIGKNNTVGINLYTSWTPIEMIRMNLNGSLDYTDIQSATNSNLRNSGFSARAFTGITLTLPNDFRIMTNGGVFSQRVQLQTTQSPYYYYNLGLMKSLFNKKLDINLSATNIFGKYIKFKNTTTGEGFTQESINNYPMRNLRLSITYRFGELKSSVRKVQRTISNEDVMQGQGSQGGSEGGGS